MHNDTGLFEHLALEGFQSGLSWSVVLKKRESFRHAFAQWDANRIAQFNERDITRLLSDPGIIRNRRKIDATITNAKALVALAHAGETLDALMWNHAPAQARPGRLRSWADVPTQTVESRALAQDLKAHGFVFVGPVTMYALMQACGLVDCHFENCLTRLGRAQR
jgi:DNA-3-methyladenine glycosylase I